MSIVSIIIPVYNSAAYIKRCLDSVAAQTFQNIECILIDDCSLDNSKRIIIDYINNYHGNKSFVLFSNKHNHGQSYARNMGIKESTGDFLFFLDSDDTITNDCIETLMSLFYKYPNIDFSQGNILQDNGAISPYGFDYSIPEYIVDKNDIYKYLLSKITTSACNRLIRRDFIIENSLLFPEGIIHEDMYWVFFIANHTKSVAFSFKGTYTYYINPNSTMTSTSKEKRIARYSSRLKAAWKYIENINKQSSNRYQRQYIAINLLSCIPELSHLHSIHNWFFFWKSIISIYYRLELTRTRIWRLFIITLLPPICFVSGNKRIRWRIQKHIISQL